jgi:hypothetical protein
MAFLKLSIGLKYFQNLNILPMEMKLHYLLYPSLPHPFQLKAQMPFVFLPTKDTIPKTVNI